MKLYIAASFRHLHAVQLLQSSLRAAVPGIEILDWTELAAPPLGLTPAQRREWMDTDLSGEVFRFCEAACGTVDLLVYLGAAGRDADGLCPSRTEGASGGAALRSEIDAGVEVGMAAASGIPILGIRGPLEAPGLMLHGAVTQWCIDAETALRLITRLSTCRWENVDFEDCRSCGCPALCSYPHPEQTLTADASCPGEKLCNMSPAAPGREG